MAADKRVLLLFFMGLLFSFSLAAQVSTQTTPPEEIQTDKDYFTRETAEGTIEIVQKLSWPASENILYYTVVLEKQNEEGLFELFGNYKTEVNELEVTLKSGEYRYRVILFNLLGKAAFETPFEPFTVKKAFIPSLTDISPAIIYLDDIYDGNFTVRGINLLPDSVFTLEKVQLKLKANSATPAQNGRSAAVSFPSNLFDTGLWRLKVENPGGFTAEIPLDIRFTKWYDLSVSGGYKPLFILFDETIQKYFGTNMSLLGAEARLTFIPYKRRFGYFGAGLNFTYHSLAGTQPGYQLGTNLFQAYAFFTYRLPIIKNRFILDAHVGPGILVVQNLLFSFPHDLYSDSFSSLYISLTAGISFQVFVYKRMYIEAGADFSVSFIPDMSLMTIMPSISVGWQF